MNEYGYTASSFLAVLKDGRHVCERAMCKTHADFHLFVASGMRAERYNVVKFYYAWGCESQEYTGSELRDVFFRE